MSSILTDVFLGGLRPVEAALKRETTPARLDEMLAALSALTAGLEHLWKARRDLIDSGTSGTSLVAITDGVARSASATRRNLVELAEKSKGRDWPAENASRLEELIPRLLAVETAATDLRDWYLSRNPTADQLAELATKAAACADGPFVDLDDAEL